MGATLTCPTGPTLSMAVAPAAGSSESPPPGRQGQSELPSPGRAAGLYRGQSQEPEPQATAGCAQEVAGDCQPPPVVDSVSWDVEDRPGWSGPALPEADGSLGPEVRAEAATRGSSDPEAPASEFSGFPRRVQGGGSRRASPGRESS